MRAMREVAGEIRRESETSRSWFARNGLTRPRRGRIVAGVCAGLARKLGVPPLLVRIAFVLSLLLPGPQALIYVVLWVLMPRDPA
jgi:phage shock protein C